MSNISCFAGTCLLARATIVGDWVRFGQRISVARLRCGLRTFRKLGFRNIGFAPVQPNPQGQRRDHNRGHN